MMMSDYEVNLVNDNMQEFYVRFKGPKETPFDGGLWKIHVELPDQYPYKSPSIGFVQSDISPQYRRDVGSPCERMRDLLTVGDLALSASMSSIRRGHPCST